MVNAITDEQTNIRRSVGKPTVPTDDSHRDKCCSHIGSGWGWLLGDSASSCAFRRIWHMGRGYAERRNRSLRSWAGPTRPADRINPRWNGWPPEVRVRRPRTSLLVDRLANAGEFVQLRKQRAEPEMYREPRDAPEIGRQPLDIRAPPQPRGRGPARPAMSLPQYVEVPVYDDHYGIAAGARHTARPGHPIHHRLAKLDVFKGEIWEKLDDFIYQVEQFATFHAWDPVETCRQAITHLTGVALAYIRWTPCLRGIVLN